MGGRNGVLGLWIAAAVALAALNGCESATPQEKEAENGRLKEEVGTLRQENIDLKQELRQANHKLGIEADAKGQLSREMEKWRADFAQLKAAGAAATTAATATAPVVTAPVVAAPAVAAPAVTDAPKVAGTEDKQEAIKTLMAQKSDLERRIAAIQIDINTGDTKTSALAKATVDRKQEVPTGGKVEGDTVYRPVPCPNPYTSQDGHYRVGRCGCLHPERSHYAPMGPATIRGDFRTALDKTTAINELKSSQAPLHVELRTLKDQLAKVTQELVRLRAAP